MQLGLGTRLHDTGVLEYSCTGSRFLCFCIVFFIFSSMSCGDEPVTLFQTRMF
ncbi:hypothetical protein BDV11DRAFT_200240 [Aspergillus similis]